MDSSNIQYYKEQLIEYLRSTKYFRNAEKAEVQKLIDAIEVNLLSVIRTNLHIDLQVVYEFIDKDSLHNLLNETNRGKSLALQNERSGGVLRNAIIFYKGYLESKKHPLAEQESKKRKKNPTKDAQSLDIVPEEKKNVVPEPESYDKLEGKKYEASVTKYERDRGNRKACIAHYGYVCQVCDMNFEQFYGELGNNFIEVHHLHPVAQGERKVDPIKDLIPLCSNCHSMIHRQEDVSDWQGLRDKYLSNKQKNKE